MTELPLDQILLGDSTKLMKEWPEKSVDLVFADPPYNLQLQNLELARPDRGIVSAVLDDWDQFAGFEDYLHFTEEWVAAAKRVLKDDGALWTIGSYHNIFIVGYVLQAHGFWLLNDVIWHKNGMPNFLGTRFQNTHETLIWCQPKQGEKYRFNYQLMKEVNRGKQMPSVWRDIPICNGSERMREGGKKFHSTQKPERLIARILLASTDEGDVVVDPFCGSGTTPAVCKKLGRRYIAIDQEARYVEGARRRVAQIQAGLFTPEEDEEEPVAIQAAGGKPGGNLSMEWEE